MNPSSIPYNNKPELYSCCGKARYLLLLLLRIRVQKKKRMSKYSFEYLLIGKVHRVLTGLIYHRWYMYVTSDRFIGISTRLGDLSLN